MAKSAPARTFAILELAEAIILELPFGDLLTHQRTCKQWHSIMAESSKVHEAIFFKPATACSLILHEGRPFSIATPINRNPLLFTHCRPNEDPMGTLVRAEASWRRQLITQPPVAEVFVQLGAIREP